MFYNIPSVAAHLYVKKLKVKGAKMPKSFFFKHYSAAGGPIYLTTKCFAAAPHYVLDVER